VGFEVDEGRVTGERSKKIEKIKKNIRAFVAKK